MRWTHVFREHHCSTATEFLNTLNPVSGPLWELNRLSLYQDQAWIFRGAWDERWLLRPSAFRDDAFAPFSRPGLPTPVATSATNQRDMEDSAIVDFCTEADHLGFHVPGDSPSLRDPRRAIPRYNPHEFPPIDKMHMCALAQHYGVPTRLLDWTRKPLIAAYFAVEKVARLSTSPRSGHRCVVWALDQGFVQDMAKRAVKRRSRPLKARKSPIDPDIYFVTAPTPSNPNLAAQGGVFTLVQPQSGDPHPIPDLDRALRPLARRVPTGWISPFFWKITLSVEEARHTLRLLSTLGIHAGTVWPGLSSIMEMFRERQHYHRVTAPPIVSKAKP